MIKILHSKDVESATVRISCSPKSGTAFFVSTEDGESVLLTSNHTLSEVDTERIYIELPDNKEVDVEIIERILDKDVAILRVKEQIYESGNPLPLLPVKIAYNDKWETFGFPAQRVTSGGRFNGIVSRINEGTTWDIDLDCDQYANLSSFEGLSGAPLIIDGFVTGIIGYDLAGTLGATSIESISSNLNKHRIKLQSKDENSIPNSIEKDIPTSTPNTEVFKRIEEVIQQQSQSSYFLISGNPGSGKTTIVAQIELEKSNNIICDRYFIKVPEEESIPTQIRATPDFFMRWLEGIIFRVLYNSPPPKTEKPLNDRILDIQQGLQQLSQYYQQQNKTAFLIIDGLDDVPKNVIENFLFVLPLKLFPNLKIIFSCTTKAVLPINLQPIISSSDEIKVTPLSVHKAEKYLTENLESKSLSFSQISELATKSEGHPLYLRYLTKFIISLPDDAPIDDLINTIPVIGGEIENYYNRIWIQLNEAVNEPWLAATLSRIRLPIEKNILLQLLPEQSKHLFIPTFNKIQHLLKDDERISVYHTSFSDFVKSKTDLIDETVHDNIANYCLSHQVKTFAISEKVFHLSKGSIENKRRALEECNQDWVDKCAISSINPDIVLADIRVTIALAAQFGISHKVISLLLLSQRVNFRYNTLFNENAIFLVSALLTLGKAEEAIRYVVRNKALTVSDEDALYLLQRFYEYGADNEAEELLEIINKTSKNILDKGFDTNSFNRYTKLKLSAVTLSSNSDPIEAFNEFEHIKNVAIKMIRRSGNPEAAVNQFKDNVGSNLYGYYIWRYNFPPTTKKVESELKYKFDNRSSGFIALSIYHALNFQDKSPIIKSDNNIPDWIEDLEYAIDKYGVHSNYYFILLYVLLGRSKRIDIIEKLIKDEYPNRPEFDLRKDNGVDLDHQAIHHFSLYAESIGFSNFDDQYPNIQPFSYSSWEDNAKRIIEYIHFLKGKVKRLIAEGKEDHIDFLTPKLIYLLDLLKPDLRSRIHWERSYALPESVFPIIYKNLTILISDHFSNQISYFIQPIINKKSYQLGIYTEGYIDSLLIIIKTLSQKQDNHLHAFKVTKVLEEHVLSTVENRWERNEYLLRLVEIYALLKNEDKANQVFKAMIDTSMGPSWYKEAQLGIINTAVSNILPKNGNLTYLQKFAAHLQQASGEMTFQRYVKQQQEEFVGDLAKVGFLQKSINYFKYLLLPDYATIIRNAESGVVDMPYEGEGYVLGARSIEEQSGILDLLSSINCGTSLVAWGLAELFLPGDDRYISGFTKVQARILNSVEDSEPNKLEALFGRFSRFVVAEVDNEDRYEYLNSLFKELSDSNFERATSYLELVGMKPAGKPKRENKEFIQDLTKDKADPLDELVSVKAEAQLQLETENKSGARKIIVDSLENIQKERYGIWSSNYSNKINDLRNLLSEAYSTSEELISSLKNLIINEPYFEEWVIANNLIRLLKNINNEQEKQLILSAVLEHIDLMVRTPNAINEYYDWISQNEDTTYDDQDKLLLELLIWFLNHPSLVIKNRTIEVLAWLGTEIPQITIEMLVQEILSEGYKISKELSAAILHQVSDLNPVTFWEQFKNSLEKDGNSLLAINHYMIRNAILQALETVQKEGISEATIWIERFKQSFTNINKKKGQVVLEEEFLEPFSDHIYHLNELEILTKQFCLDFLNLVKLHCPLSIDESQRASKYIDRSFNNHNNNELVSDFDNILRYALNVAITPLVDLANREHVASILRFYQPTFPENKLCSSFTNGGEKIEIFIKSIFEKGTLDFQDLTEGKEIIINFFSKEFTESRSSSDTKVELTAFLIPIAKYRGDKHSYPWLTYQANGYPEVTLEEQEEDVIPLIIKSEYAMNVTGSELVPALPLENSLQYFDNNPRASVTLTYWRTGRNWDQHRFGISQKTGYHSTISISSVQELKAEYKLIWQLIYKNKIKYVDVFEQKLIR